MTLSLSEVVASLLEDAPDKEVRTAILQAGAPGVFAARTKVERSPASIRSLKVEDAATVVSVLEDVVVLGEIRKLDTRLGVKEALARNPLASPQKDTSVVDASRVPPGSPTLEEARVWVNQHNSRTRDFFSWLVLSSPDPVLFLTEYATGGLGVCYPEILLTLQYHEDVMTLDVFMGHVPLSWRARLWDSLRESDTPLDTSLVALFVAHKEEFSFYSSYTPAARAFLRESTLPRHRAIALLSASEDESPDVAAYRELPVELQTAVLLQVSHPFHQQAYAPHVDFQESVGFDHDPTHLLGKVYLNFDARLNLMRWASAEELFEHLHASNYSDAELQRVARQVFSDVSQLITMEHWNRNLDAQDENDPSIKLLVNTTMQEAPRVVGYALETHRTERVLTREVRSRLHAYCGTHPERWESILSLGPDWAGTLPELLECVGLTGD